MELNLVLNCGLGSKTFGKSPELNFINPKKLFSKLHQSFYQTERKLQNQNQWFLSKSRTRQHWLRGNQKATYNLKNDIKWGKSNGKTADNFQRVGNKTEA
jgi:hypothetical protein